MRFERRLCLGLKPADYEEERRKNSKDIAFMGLVVELDLIWVQLTLVLCLAG